jgi:hypothetical protein
MTNEQIEAQKKVEALKVEFVQAQVETEKARTKSYERMAEKKAESWFSRHFSLLLLIILLATFLVMSWPWTPSGADARTECEQFCLDGDAVVSEFTESHCVCSVGGE